MGVTDMGATKTQTKKAREQLACRGSAVATKARHLLNEGNTRRVRIRRDDHEVMSFPVTIGVAGTILAPWLAAIGAVATFVGPFHVDVERDAPRDEIPDTAPDETANAG